MSESRYVECRPVSRRLSGLSRAWIPLIVLLLLGGLLYSHGAFQYFMYDDEGSYAYAAWRIGLGEVPYRDFLTSEMPAFLYWGGLLVRLFGRSFVALRLASMLATLLAACLLYAANREVLGVRVAAASTALFLVEPNVFHNARYFRAEAFMLLFELAGIYALVLAEKRGRLRYLVVSGAFFALSALNKLSGLLPFAACFVYLGYACWRRRRPAGRLLRQALALGVPALLVAGITAAMLAPIAPQFYRSVLQHQIAGSAGMSFLRRPSTSLALYRAYASEQLLVLLLAGLGGLLALRRGDALRSLPLWVFPTVLAFMPLSRDLHPRYLTYLAPAVATLAALALVAVLRSLWQRLVGRRWPTLAAVPLIAGTLGLAALAVYPWVCQDARDVAPEEHDSEQLAALIRSLAPEDSAVIADNQGLNFLTGRRSTYWAAEISEARALSGQIRGALLADEIEGQDVAVLVINTEGGGPHMAAMADYREFQHYIDSRYVSVQSHQCSDGRNVFVVYARPDLLPAYADPDDRPPLLPGWAWIEVRLHLPAGETLPEPFSYNLWTVVQWQDAAGGWHDVEGWRGPLKWTDVGEGYAGWAVAPTDLGKGPFRWLAMRGADGLEVAASEPFYLPEQAGDIQRCEFAGTP